MQHRALAARSQLEQYARRLRAVSVGERTVPSMPTAGRSRIALALVAALATLAAVFVATSPGSELAPRIIRPGMATLHLPGSTSDDVALYKNGTRLIDPQVTASSTGPDRIAVELPTLWSGSYELNVAGTVAPIIIGDPEKKHQTLEACAASAVSTEVVVCLSDFLPKMVSDLGPTAARNELLRLSQEHPSFGENCDHWAIAFAEAVVTLIGLNEAITADAHVCRFSYLHGVAIAAALRGFDASELSSLCATPNPHIDVYAATSQCGHGTGHGALTATYGDTDTALTWCEKVTELHGARSNCMEGVYMHLQMSMAPLSERNAAAELGGPQPKISMPDPSECRGDTDDFGNACYRYTMAAALSDVPEEDRAKQLVEWNALCTASAHAGCWFGMGEVSLRNAIGRVSDPDAPLDDTEITEILDLCSNRGNLEEVCAIRVLTLSIWSTLDLDTVAPLCKELRRRIRDVCSGEEIATWMKMMSQTAAVDPRFHK